MDKPKNGSVQFKEGKGKIYWNDKWNDFNIDFVIQDMKRAIRGLHPTAYVRMIHDIKRDLRNRGMFAINDSRKKLKLLLGDNRLGVKELSKLWDSWFNSILMFKNIKTGKQKTIPTKNYRDNFDNIFKKEN